MQGSAADIVKLAMNGISREISRQGLHAKMLLQVHDELDFSCPEGELARLTDLVKQIMEHVVDLSVPLTVDIASSSNWSDAH